MGLTVPLAPPLFCQRTVDSVRVFSQIFQMGDRLGRLPFVCEGHDMFAVAKDIFEFLVMLGKLFDLGMFTFGETYLHSFQVPLPRSLFVRAEPW